MSEQTSESRLSAWLRPRVMFPILAVLVLASVLLSPRRGDNDTAPNLRIESTSPGGASGLAETLRRLGWGVSRAIDPISDTSSTTVVHAVLAGANTLSATEVHTLLEHVRRGGAFLVVFAQGSALGDSLKLGRSRWPGVLSGPIRDDVSCPPETRISRRARMLAQPEIYSLRARAPLPANTERLLSAGARSGAGITMLGLPIGAGRLVVVSDAHVLVNELMRTCRSPAGVAAVRAVEWLSQHDSGVPKRSIVFEEHYFGYGKHASISRTGRAWLLDTPSGRTTLQLSIAGLLLLAAFAPRPIVPVAAVTMPRRSPLEHVGALARAYEQVRGTRTAARRLVQGLRRRSLRPTTAHSASDDEFLADIARRIPAARVHVARVLHALNAPVAPGELIGVAESVNSIERALNR